MNPKRIAILMEGEWPFDWPLSGTFGDSKIGEVVYGYDKDSGRVGYVVTGADGEEETGNTSVEKFDIFLQKYPELYKKVTGQNASEQEQEAVRGSEQTCWACDRPRGRTGSAFCSNCGAPLNIKALIATTKEKPKIKSVLLQIAGDEGVAALSDIVFNNKEHYQAIRKAWPALASE